MTLGKSGSSVGRADNILRDCGGNIADDVVRTLVRLQPGLKKSFPTGVPWNSLGYSSKETMTPLDLLSRTRDLLADPQHWTQKASGRNKDGEPVAANSDDAVCWCAMGALWRVSPTFDPSANGTHTLVRQALRAAIASLMGVDARTSATVIMEFNDSRSHSEILTIFDLAISILQRQTQNLLTS